MKKKTIISISLVLIVFLSGCSGPLWSDNTTTPTTTTKKTTTEKPITTTPTTTTKKTTTPPNTENPRNNKEFPAGINSTGMFDPVQIYKNHINSTRSTSFRNIKQITIIKNGTEYNIIQDTKFYYTYNNNSYNYTLRKGVLNGLTRTEEEIFYTSQLNNSYQRQTDLINNVSVYREIQPRTKTQIAEEVLMEQTITDILPSFNLEVEQRTESGGVVLHNTRTTDLEWLNKYTYDAIENPKNASFRILVSPNGLITHTQLIVNGKNNSAIKIEEKIALDATQIDVPDWAREMENNKQKINISIDETKSYIGIDYKQGVDIPKGTEITIQMTDEVVSVTTDERLTENNKYYLVFSENRLEMLSEKPSTRKYALPKSDTFLVRGIKDSRLVFLEEMLLYNSSE